MEMNTEIQLEKLLVKSGWEIANKANKKTRLIPNLAVKVQPLHYKLILSQKPMAFITVLKNTGIFCTVKLEEKAFLNSAFSLKLPRVLSLESPIQYLVFRNNLWVADYRETDALLRSIETFYTPQEHQKLDRKIF